MMIKHADWIILIIIIVLVLSTMITTSVAASLINKSGAKLDPSVNNAFKWTFATAVVNGILLLFALIALGYLLYEAYGPGKR